MKKKAKPATPKRRATEAVLAWRLGMKVKPSGKTYNRKPRHKKPRPTDGVSDSRGLFPPRGIALETSRVYPNPTAGIPPRSG